MANIGYGIGHGIWTGGHDGTGGGAKNNQLIDDKGSGTALDVAGGGEGILMSCRAAVVLV